MKHPAISVILPAYNAAPFLERAVASVTTQTFRDWELIIVDDASTDDTAAIARNLTENDKRIHLLQLKTNGGPSVARNAGIKASKAPWIAILDADDVIMPSRLAQLYALALSNRYDMVADNLHLFDAGARVMARTLIPQNGTPIINWTLEYFAKHDLPNSGSYLGWLKPMFNKQFLISHGLRYRPQYRYGEDFLLYAEILALGGRAAIARHPGYIYTTRIGEVSRTSAGNSRTHASSEQLVKASLFLELNYKDRISPATLKALAFRRCQNALAPAFADFKNNLFSRPYKSAYLLITHPQMIWHILRVARRLPRALPAIIKHRITNPNHAQTA